VIGKYMATKAQLISSLENLISKADEQEQIFQSSRAKLYLLLGETYAWWRDASRFEGFLESLYEQHNIKKRGKEEKFTQILRLIWKKEWNGKDGATLQTWSNGLQAVHKVVESNPNAYKESMAIKISQFLHTVGGLRGAVGDTRTEVNFFDETVNNNKRRNSKLDIESALSIKKKHLELGKQYFTKTNRYLINIVNNKSAIAASNEGYAVALVKQDKRFQNKFKILSVTADTTLINEAIVKTYRRNSESTPYTLRLLGEIIKTQSLPIALENHRDHLLDKSKVKNKDGIAMKQMKRIVIRSKSKDILLSESRTDCSVVTIVKPKNQIINSLDDLVLRINDHRYIEQEIIQTDDMSFNTSLSESLKRVLDKDIKASYKLEIKNIVTNKIRNI
jgi:hypothetical protein